VPGAPNAAPPPGRAQNAPPTVAPAFRQAPEATAPLPAPPPVANVAPIRAGAPPSGPQRLDDFRGQRRESQQGGRTIITEPGRIIIRDPGGQQYVRHSEVDRFRYGARDIQTQTVGGETRTVVIRPDGTQVITVVGRAISYGLSTALGALACGRNSISMDIERKYLEIAKRRLLDALSTMRYSGAVRAKLVND